MTLERLRCIRESDGTGHSEPYIWPALLWIDDHTLATPELVGVTAPALGNARVVIKSDMRAGETADIPSSVGRVLRVRFEDGLSTRRLILAVVLWEEDETPEAAMRAGFQAFSSELRAAVAANLLALSQANEEEETAIVATIKTRVSARVRSALENGLTAAEKARVLLGTLNLDDPINSDFKSLPDLRATPITLTFSAGSSDDYEIQGHLQVLPVVVDRCQAQVNAVEAAQAAVDAIDAQIRQLQDELQHASPAEKPFIISEIRRLREERPVAMAAFEDARRALQTCRESTTIPPVLELNGRWTDGSSRSAVISAAFTALTVDMSAFNRPAANGSIVDASTITVTFPDDATHTGQLLPPIRLDGPMAQRGRRFESLLENTGNEPSRSGRVRKS